jgi:hypothetical protein
MRAHPATAVTLALSTLLCCGATSGSCNTSNDQIGPSKGEVVGVAVAAVAVVAVAAVVLVEVSHSHHTLKGCVFNGANGLELRTDDNKTYTLSGTTGNIAPGNTVRLHGDRKKAPKGTISDPEFFIQKMEKNYGPCQALALPPSPAAPRS